MEEGACLNIAIKEAAFSCGALSNDEGEGESESESGKRREPLCATTKSKTPITLGISSEW